MASIGNITFACADPGELATFWAAAVDHELEPAPPGLLEAIEAEGGDTNAAAAAVDPDGRGPRLSSRSCPARPPSTSRSTST